MRKIWIAAAGLLCLNAGGALSKDLFEEQAVQWSHEIVGALGNTKKILAASQAQIASGAQALNPLDALDESKVGVSAKFIPIKPGEFEMGSPPDEEGRGENEVQHHVKLAKGFEMQATAVTQLQYLLVTGENPSRFRHRTFCDKGNFQVLYGRKEGEPISLCANHPVERVDWYGAQYFIRRLNRTQDKCVYRLPTEAEWEYAARGGPGMPSSLPYSFGFNDTNELGNYAWYHKNSHGHTHAVATKRADPILDLYDMHGNVAEWVQDYEGDYPTAAVTDPTGPASGWFRVFRGGSFVSRAMELRSAFRRTAGPDWVSDDLGFRLVRSCR